MQLNNEIRKRHGDGYSSLAHFVEMHYLTGTGVLYLGSQVILAAGGFEKCPEITGLVGHEERRVKVENFAESLKGLTE